MRCRPCGSFALGLLLFALAATGCSRFRPQQPHDVVGASDPNATYAVVLDTLNAQKYTVLDQDTSSHTVHVRAHIGEHDSHPSVIQIAVDGAGAHLSASGYLVHPDGTIHRALNAELASLDQKLTARLATNPAAVQSPSTAFPPAIAAPPSALPVAWSEPAYDPKVWGHGNFTCLPVKLAEDRQAELTLKLSNGENADVVLSLAHAPELCRSAASCKLPGGCPALGMADADRVARLAARLQKHEIGPLATLFSRGQALVTIDLSKHGSIAEALAEKH